MEFENDFLIEDKQNKGKKNTFKILLNILIAIVGVMCVITIVFYTIFFQIRVIGVSMQPTYNELLSIDEDPDTSPYQDVVVVNRFYKGNNGDVIIIKTASKNLIKRLIAKAGQTLVLKRIGTDEYFKFYVDNQELDEKYLGENYKNMDSQYFNQFRNVDGAVVGMDEDGNLQASLVIPDGHVFALGDNRGNSADSLTYGPFEESQVLGTVAMSYKYNENIFVGIWHAIFG